MTIYELVHQSYSLAKEKGWHDQPRSILEALALVHSEVSEAVEDVRRGVDPVAITGIIPTMAGDYIEKYERGRSFPVGVKPTGLPIELADAVIRIADLCGELGIDLEKAIEIKHEYNKTRPYRHGKVL